MYDYDVEDAENSHKLSNKHLEPDKMANCFDYDREEIYIKYIELASSENKIEDVIDLSKYVWARLNRATPNFICDLKRIFFFHQIAVERRQIYARHSEKTRTLVSIYYATAR